MQAVTFRVEGDLARRAEAPRDLGEVGRRLDPVRRDRGDRFRSRSGLRLEDGLLEPLVPSTKRLEAFLVGDHVEAGPPDRRAHPLRPRPWRERAPPYARRGGRGPG